MSRATQFRMILACSLVAVGASSVSAGPLLFSFDRQQAGGSTTIADPAVEILLVHDAGVVPLELTILGEGILWDDGDTGTVDFTSLTDPNFDALVAGLTNGIDEIVSVWTLWPNQGGGGGGDTESRLGFGSPDLFGYEIDLIRLTVRDVQIEPWKADGFFAKVDLTYDFYGSLIPEPATLTLLAVGAVAILRRKRRWQQQATPLCGLSQR